MSDLDQLGADEGMFKQLSAQALTRLDELACPCAIMAYDEKTGQVYMTGLHLNELDKKSREVIASAAYHAILNLQQ